MVGADCDVSGTFNIQLISNNRAQISPTEDPMVFSLTIGKRGFYPMRQREDILDNSVGYVDSMACFWDKNFILGQ